MRVLLIVNTTASSVTARKRVLIQKALGAEHDLEVMETSRRGHAARLARGATRRGVEVVAVLGGDGTLNEAADGLVGTPTVLAPLPGGSTNVYARTLGVAHDPVDATNQLLASLARRSFRRIGLGRVNGRYFLFHCGIGFDAAVVAQVERHGWIKRYAGHPLFVAASFDTFLRTYDRSRGRFVVTLGSGEVIEGGTLAIVSKTSPYTYLSRRPIVVAPEAGLDTPLSITVVKARRASTMLSVAAAALLSPQMLHRHPNVEHRERLTSLTVTGAEPFPYQVDGDYLGEVTKLEFAYAPHVITIAVP